MTPAFDRAVNIVLDHEGGYVNDPIDPGGETKFGISKRAYPKLNIKDLTKDQAKEIYHRDYWQKIRGDKLPEEIAIMVFDMAVNMGVRRSVQILQRVLNVKIDGVIGDRTLDASYAMRKEFILERLTIARILHYTGLDTFERFGRGWVSRSVEVLVKSLGR